jgi:hypothetical protein
MTKHTIILLVIFLIFAVGGVGIAVANRIQIERESMGLTITPEAVSFDYQHLDLERQGTIKERITYSEKAKPTLNGKPRHVKIEFMNDRFSDLSFPRKPQMFIFPLDRYRGLYEAQNQTDFDQKISLIESAIAVGDESIQGQIPILPFPQSQQIFHAREEVIAFRGGTGIRFVTQYGESGDAITNEHLVYVYQGRTDDNKYHVSLFVPLELGLLPKVQERMTPEELALLEDPDTYETYIKDTTKDIQEAEAEAFFPSIEAVDLIIRSLQID